MKRKMTLSELQNPVMPEHIFGVIDGRVYRRCSGFNGSSVMILDSDGRLSQPLACPECHLPRDDHLLTYDGDAWILASVAGWVVDVRKNPQFRSDK